MKVVLLSVLLLVFSAQGFQPDEFEAEPFLQVSDSYLQEHKLTPLFGKEHLSLNQQFTPANTPKALLWGETDRVVVMLQVRHQGKHCNKTRNVVFMVDTGTPATIISPKVKKLISKDCKIKSQTLGKVPIEINGRSALAKVSKDTFYFDTNVLGMDFLKDNEITFSMKINKSNRDKSDIVFSFDQASNEL